MRQYRMDFGSRLRSVADPAGLSRLVFVGNFEVENKWRQGEIGLPTFSLASSDLVVNRMDEFTLTLAGPHDVVVLKEHPDPGFVDYLSGLGLRLPRVLVPACGDPRRTVTEDVLRDHGLQRELAALDDGATAIYPHGVSPDEEAMAAACGLPLAAPPATVCKSVNSKVYSRRLADRLGLRQPRGWACDSVDTWAAAADASRSLLAAGRTMVVKDAYGVSGKGIVHLRNERRLDQLDRMTAARVRRVGPDHFGLVLEEWVAKVADLNYQFTVGRDGTVHFDFVKRAITEQGVHKGHEFPAGLTPRLYDQILDTASALGPALAADGYFGVIGVDAMIDPAGELYPIVEINARNNMSTYQLRLQEEVIDEGRSVLARHYPLTVSAPVTFDRIASALGDLLLTTPGAGGLLVNNFATLNAALPAAKHGTTVEGRLYGMVVGSDSAAVRRLDAEIERALSLSPVEGGTA